MIIVVVVVLWIVCSVLSYGLSLAHFQRRFNAFGFAKRNRWQDVCLCLFLSVMGPAALASLLLNGYVNHGWIWRPIPDDEVNYGP